MEAFIQQLERLFAADDLAGAEGLVAACAGSDPARHALGLAALAAHHKDAAGCMKHARQALALAPQQPMVLQQMAVAHLMRGEHASAEEFAQQAVEQAVDPGGAVRSLGWLANIRLGSGKIDAAEGSYRHMLELDPGNVQALNGLGAARYKKQDLDGAVNFLARAYDQNPVDPAPIRSMMNMYGEAGRVLGAIALANLTRQRHKDGESQVALDLMLLHLTRTLLGDFPPAGVVDDADEAVAALLASSKRRPVRVRLGVARALLDCGRGAEAEQAVAGITEGEAALSVADRGNLHYVRGLIQAASGQKAGALEHYLLSVAADPRRWDACCNAMTILLERGDAGSLGRVADLLASVPAEVKGVAPQLLFNEAVYLRRIGQVAAAQHNLSRAVAATGPDSQIGQLARGLLAEVEDGIAKANRQPDQSPNLVHGSSPDAR